MMITKTTIILFVILVVVYISMGLMLYFRQKEIIYYPTKQDFDACRAFAQAEKLNMNGTRAYFERNTDTVAVFYHGNAGSACGRTYIKRFIEGAGHSYLIVEYAGYSNDKRKPSKELLFQDAENVTKFIEENNFQKVLLIGESLGSAVAAHHANVGRYDAMLLLTPFDSLANVAQSAFPHYPAKWLLKEDYDNVAMLKDKDNIWIMHGTRDRVIPIKRSKALFEELEGQNNEYHEVPGAGHNNLFGFEETIKIVNSFVELKL